MTAMARTDHIIFHVNGFTCALPVMQIVHISSMVALDPLPGLPTSVVGTCMFHGEIVFGIDLSVVLGLRPHTFSSSARMLIVRRGPVLLGVLADGVGDIVEADTSAAPDAPGVKSDAIQHLFHLGTTPVYVIDPWRALGANDAEIVSTLSRFTRPLTSGGTS